MAETAVGTAARSGRHDGRLDSDGCPHGSRDGRLDSRLGSCPDSRLDGRADVCMDGGF